ncbi:MAG: hypothetical protein ACYTG2_06100 [Planctomycetota bacterium]|jgi:hypothetical protein
MTRFQAGASALAAGVLILACAAAVRPAGAPAAGDRVAAGQADVTPIVLGTFDSRAVAVAWVGSDAFRAIMAGLHQDLADAKAAGDEARVAELEALGPQMQARIHRQGFSTAPVHDILEHIRGELPALAGQAGVDVIVSKWDLVYQAPSASFVDVTELLAGAFEPDEKTWKTIRDLVTTDPVPADQLEHDH